MPELLELRMNRSVLGLILLSVTILFILVAWKIDRSVLVTRLENQIYDNQRLKEDRELLKTGIVRKYTSVAISDRAIDSWTMRVISDDVFQEKPDRRLGGIIWDSVSEALPNTDFKAYHIHFDNVSEIPQHVSPGDYLIFADNSNQVIAVGIEQGINTGSTVRRSCVSIYKDQEWKFQFL